MSIRILALLVVVSSCVDSSDVPGATNVCDTRLGPVAGCGAGLGGGAINQIRTACTKLASCGLVAIQGNPDTTRTFDECVGAFEQYPIDTLPAILDCIARSSCEQLSDPMDGTHSICERFGR